MYTDFNAGANDDYLILPGMTLTGNQQLKYWVRARSATEPNDYQVMISTTGTAPGDFSPIFNETVNFTTYTERIVDLSAYSGTVYIAMHVPQGGLDGYYLYMDDFTVENLPTCFAPSAVTVSNITTTGATLDWTPPAQAPASYDVYVSTTNTAPTGATTPTYTGVANPYALTGLTANTTYYVWVRGNCGGTDVSTWTSVKSFATACDAINVPYTENFNGVTPPAIPSCIIVENTNNDNTTWRTTTGITGVPAVTSNAIINQFHATNPADDWFFIRTLNLTAGQSYTLKFKYLASSAPDYTEKLQVQLGTAANSAAMTGQVIFDEPNVNSTSYVQANVQFTVPST
ncbi:MAG: hypothetical protein EOO52_20345 [Gammaproteobacteria bacterium]|nr:MAG: hypothetical protein EOO52_20345 [Gammaproteobacteria bacterium]